MKMYNILTYIQLNNWYKKANTGKQKEAEAFKCIYKKIKFLWIFKKYKCVKLECDIVADG